MANDEQAVSISDVVARNVRRIRGDRSQDDLASAARAAGLAWSRQVISGIESGVRRLDLAEATLLAVALRVGLLELLAGDEVVALSQEASAPLPAVRQIVGSEAIGEMPIDVIDRPESRAFSDAVHAAAGHWAELSMGLSLSLDEAVKAENAAGQLAERRSAVRLRTTPLRVSLAAFDLWGHSLSAERDARAAARAPDTDRRSVQAFRGRITRELLAELARRLEAADRG